MARNKKQQPTDGIQFTHKLDVFYDGLHHEVQSFDTAWHLAMEHAPAKITDLEQ